MVSQMKKNENLFLIWWNVIVGNCAKYCLNFMTYKINIINEGDGDGIRWFKKLKNTYFKKCSSRSWTLNIVNNKIPILLE